ncbi:MAG: efflux transporter outer membrane subunit [Paludibacteraceae bacterium]|nr:efflux transporter outer membrane subunit [Paludibacteraceae bacterium]
MKRIVYILVLGAMLSSCGLYGKYSRPEQIKGEGLYGTGVTENTDSATLASLSYKEIFTDPQLQVLIGTALERNSDLRSLEYAVRQAEAGYQASKLAFVPGFTFAPKGGYNISETAKGWGYAIPVAMDWEIDLFGKLVNQKRKAGASLLMTQDIREAAQTQIVATVASLYFQLLMMDQLLLVTDSTARKWQETVRVMDLMKEAGMMNEVSVSQTQATCYAIQAGVLDLQEGIRNVENGLCLLLKQPPQPIARGTMQAQVLPEELQVGVSAQLLSNRPDVRQAEHNLEQYFYGVQHARSMFFPSIRIDASAAFVGAFVPSLVGSLVQPIFAHGGIKANYDISKAQYEQALLQFEQQMLKAGSEVNDALLQCQTARLKREQHTQQVEALTRAMDKTRSLMNNGSTTYLEVIYAQQALLDAQTSQLEDWLDEAQGVVKLYQALGGGVK